MKCLRVFVIFTKAAVGMVSAVANRDNSLPFERRGMLRLLAVVGARRQGLSTSSPKSPNTPEGILAYGDPAYVRAVDECLGLFRGTLPLPKHLRASFDRRSEL